MPLKPPLPAFDSEALLKDPQRLLSRLVMSIALDRPKILVGRPRDKINDKPDEDRSPPDGDR